MASRCLSGSSATPRDARCHFRLRCPGLSIIAGTGGSFMACTDGVSLGTQFGGLKSMFSGEGLFFIECTGSGDLFFNTYGALIEKDVVGDFTVDTGHVVAWEPTLSYTIRGMGGLKSTLLSGEGLALSFSGVGKIYLQSRTMPALAGWLAPFG